MRGYPVIEESAGKLKKMIDNAERESTASCTSRTYSPAKFEYRIFSELGQGERLWHCPTVTASPKKEIDVDVWIY